MFRQIARRVAFTPHIHLNVVRCELNVERSFQSKGQHPSPRTAKAAPLLRRRIRNNPYSETARRRHVASAYLLFLADPYTLSTKSTPTLRPTQSNQFDEIRHAYTGLLENMRKRGALDRTMCGNGQLQSFCQSMLLKTDMTPLLPHHNPSAALQGSDDCS